MITQAQHEQARRELGFPIGEIDVTLECAHKWILMGAKKYYYATGAKAVYTCAYCGIMKPARCKWH